MQRFAHAFFDSSSSTLQNLHMYNWHAVSCRPTDPARRHSMRKAASCSGQSQAWPPNLGDSIHEYCMKIRSVGKPCMIAQGLTLLSRQCGNKLST